MQFADLHIHSKYSDGNWWPEQIIDIAKKKNIKYLSITDHDTIGSQYIIGKHVDDNDINIISGIELSSEYDDREVHILGYFIDVKNKQLISNLKEIKLSRELRAESIIGKLNELNINIDLGSIKRENKDLTIGRLHIAKALVEKNIVKNTKEAFQKYLIKDKPAYIKRRKISYKDAFALILQAGGIPVLAHPGKIYNEMAVEKMIKQFKVYGLKGIEVYHPSHTRKQTNNYYNYAKKYSLLITGGSDCHGVNNYDKSIIGSCGLNEDLTSKLLKYK